MDRAEPGGMTVDRHIVGRVGEHHRRALLAEQGAKRCHVEHVAAKQPVLVHQPQIAGPADCRPDRNLGCCVDRVVALGRRLVERFDPQIDLAHLEAGDLEAEIEALQ
jgi:hypothetical protein